MHGSVGTCLVTEGAVPGTRTGYCTVAGTDTVQELYGTGTELLRAVHYRYRSTWYYR